VAQGGQGSNQLILTLWSICSMMAVIEKAKNGSCGVWLLWMAGTCRQGENYCHRSLHDGSMGGREPMAILILKLIKFFQEKLEEHGIAVGAILELLGAMGMLFFVKQSSRIS